MLSFSGQKGYSFGLEFYQQFYVSFNLQSLNPISPPQTPSSRVNTFGLYLNRETSSLLFSFIISPFFPLKF